MEKLVNALYSSGDKDSCATTVTAKKKPNHVNFDLPPLHKSTDPNNHQYNPMYDD